jgi:hypothetical protein
LWIFEPCKKSEDSFKAYRKNFTTLKFWTDYRIKYIIFIELCMKEDSFAHLKGK